MKITIIGSGNLGSAIGYEIANRDIIEELVFIDIKPDFAEGQASDIAQAIAFRNNTVVRAGDYNDASDSDILIVTAGKPRTPEIKSRLELAEINSKIIKDIALRIKEIGFSGILITLTNPMDLMNYLLWKQTGLSRFKVIGSGGQLDSSRFRTVLAKIYNKNVMDVEAFVISEHGDNQVPVFSNVKISNRKVDFSDDEKEKISAELKKSALNVISKKGATIFAPANNTADMIQSIVKDERKLMSCSVVLDGEYGLRDLSIGVPVILGQSGVEEILEWNLSNDELAVFRKGADELKRYMANL